MGVTLTDVLLFGKAQSDDVDNATLVIYRRNILRWNALGGYLDVIVKGVAPLSLPDAIADSLSYVNAFGGTEQRDIPDNYLQRQFIYMMDGSYLLTDIMPTYDCKIEMDFQTTSLTTTGAFLGGRSAAYPAGLVFGYSNTTVNFDGFSSNRYTDSNILANDTRYKYTWNNQVATLESGGSVVSTNTFTGTDANGDDLAINAINSSGSIVGNAAGIYLYSFRVWNAQGELVADYVPAIQKGTVPVVGFYDTITGTFKTATAGTFAAGGEAVPTPDAPMDIVSNNGVLKASINEFDANAITNGYFYNADLEWVENSSVCTTDYMKTVKGKYTLVLGNVTTLSATVNVRVNLFNANKEIQSQTVIPITVDTTEYTYEVDIPDGISYVRVSTNPMYVVVSGFSNSKTVYTDGTVETIKDSLNNTATAEILLKVGDYQDTQSILDGVITRNVGVFVLDGTENWQNGSGTYATNCFCDNLLPNLKRPEEGNSPAICTAFPMVERISDFSAGKGYVSSNPACRVNLWYNDTAANFKQYLADQYAAGTPVIVLYPLATPTTESVAGQTLQVQTGDNTLEITQASLTGLELEAQYKKSA